MKATISFEEDRKLINELLQILIKEQSNLVLANVDEVDKLLEKKSVVLQKINEAAKKRYVLLAEKSFEANENGMQLWLKSEKNKTIQNAWDQFQQTIQQAKEINRLNGVLISKHFSRNQQLLNGLQNALTTHQTYGENGQTKTTLNSRGSLQA